MLEITEKTEAIDALHTLLEGCEQVDCPLIHLFTPGMYIREIFMPKGTVIVSKIHNTTHPYIVSKGVVAVYNSEKDFSGVIEAPFTGITYPNTRRVLEIIEDTIWTTFHPLPYITGEEMDWSDAEKLALVDRIEDEIIQKRMLKNKEMEAIG